MKTLTPKVTMQNESQRGRAVMYFSFDIVHPGGYMLYGIQPVVSMQP